MLESSQALQNFFRMGQGHDNLVSVFGEIRIAGVIEDGKASDSSEGQTVNTWATQASVLW